MTKREELKKAYDNLLEGQKKRASQVYGCESTYFTAIANGTKEVKDESIIEQMIQAVKQASKDVLDDAQESFNKINKL